MEAIFSPEAISAGESRPAGVTPANEASLWGKEEEKRLFRELLDIF